MAIHHVAQASGLVAHCEETDMSSLQDRYDLIFEVMRWPDPHYFPPMPIVRLSASVNYTRGTLQALLRPVNLHRILKDRDSPTSIGFGQLSLYLQQRRSDVFVER